MPKTIVIVEVRIVMEKAHVIRPSGRTWIVPLRLVLNSPCACGGFRTLSSCVSRRTVLFLAILTAFVVIQLVFAPLQLPQLPRDDRDHHLMFAAFALPVIHREIPEHGAPEAELRNVLSLGGGDGGRVVADQLAGGPGQAKEGVS